MKIFCTRCRVFTFCNTSDFYHTGKGEFSKQGAFKHLRPFSLWLNASSSRGSRTLLFIYFLFLSRMISFQFSRVAQLCEEAAKSVSVLIIYKDVKEKYWVCVPAAVSISFHLFRQTFGYINYWLVAFNFLLLKTFSYSLNKFWLGD